MKIQCDVCERAPATVICCADEAALCGKCDVEVHAANKLASKHHRLLLHSLSSNLIPKCDICQDKTALIFCVEDRALFCQDCDEPIHSANSLTANHQRLLATGIKVALMMTSASCTDKTSTSFDPPPPPTALDDLLDHLSDFDHPSDHKQQHKDPLDLGGFEWLADMGLLGEPQEALEVPQLRPISPPTNFRSPAKSDAPFKKLRIETPIDDDEFFIVPDLG